MEIERFRARMFSAQELEDLDVFVVVLAEHDDGAGARLEIQRSLTEDEQSEALGLTGYCLCTADGAAVYGGVASWRIESGILEVMLTPAGTSVLRVDGFAISLEDVAVSELRAGLERVFAARTTA